LLQGLGLYGVEARDSNLINQHRKLSIINAIGN